MRKYLPVLARAGGRNRQPGERERERESERDYFHAVERNPGIIRNAQRTGPGSSAVSYRRARNTAVEGIEFKYVERYG